MDQNNFDRVMDYIDENIQNQTESLKQGIFELTGHNIHHFNYCFKVLTGRTLFNYITERRLYFAAKELSNKKDRQICDIALDFGYSEQSAFTKAMKDKFNCTPNEIRKGEAYISSYKYELKDFSEEESKIRNIIRKMEDEELSDICFDYLDGVQRMKEDYSFLDLDTCYEIADLAESLAVPMSRLAEACFDIMCDIQSDSDYIPPKVEAAINCDIETEEELDEICEYYNCDYRALTCSMVKRYRQKRKEG